jgi:hypothetical protein
MNEKTESRIGEVLAPVNNFGGGSDYVPLAIAQIQRRFLTIRSGGASARRAATTGGGLVRQADDALSDVVEPDAEMPSVEKPFAVDIVGAGNEVPVRQKDDLL